MIWFGVGTPPALSTAFLISFFSIVVNVATEVATVEPELCGVLRSLGANKLGLFVEVGFSRALPYFFASLKVAATLAFVRSIVAELGTSNRGIGNLMVIASSRFDVLLVFADLFMIALIGIALYAAFAILERRVVAWAYR